MHVPRRHRNPFARCHGLLLVLVAAVLAPSAQAAADRAAQQLFVRAYAQAQAGDAHWRDHAAALRDYPLYPYLESAYLRADIAKAKPAAVQAYLARYGDLIPGRELRRAWLDQLAAQHDWPQYLADYQPGLGTVWDCRALQAQAGTGQALHFAGAFADLWQQARLPAACDDMLALAQARGLLTPARVWARIEQSLQAGAAGSLRQAIAWLPQDQQAGAQRLLLALTDSAAALAQAGTWPDTPHARQALVLALTRRAVNDDGGARVAWQSLRTRFDLDARQQGQIEAALALFAATSFDPGARRALIALPAAAQTPVTREWRVRVALAEGDWQGVYDGIAAMPPAQRDANTWRYFEARALAELGFRQRADALWRTLARQATYFGFLAADRLQRPYALCPRDPSPSHAARAAVLANPGMQRAFAWWSLQRPAHARREWDEALPTLDGAQRYAAAVLAQRAGWVDRAVFLLGSGQALRDYKLRFPLAERGHVERDAARSGLSAPWVLATIRTESAWMSDARSGANAWGLMQLLPGTAARVARRHGLDFGGAATLDNPAVNIRLGTLYLRHLATRFGGQWLASAAYNAGPAALQRWLDKRPDLPPDVFIATIPYPETRGYVESTLAFSVIYDWLLHGTPVRIGARMLPYGDPYALPGAQAPRAAVLCSDADLLAQGGTPSPAAAVSAAAPAASAPAVSASAAHAGAR